MFEAKPPVPGAAPGRHGPLADEELHALAWSELVARLAAARDLRAALAYAPPPGGASFDAGCAGHLADLATHNSKPGVNPEPSADGKSAWGKDGLHAECDRPDTRGSE